MGLVERAKLWRRMGQILDSEVGGSVAQALGGAVNTLGAIVTTRIDEGVEIPWTPVEKPLAESVVTLITTAGFHLEGDQPFDVDSREGDPSFRVIPAEVELAELRVAHTHYSHRYVKEDPNVLFPLERLRELEAEGVLRLAPRTFSFGFGGRLTRPFIEPPDGTAHRLAELLQEDQVDLALLVPA